MGVGARGSGHVIRIMLYLFSVCFAICVETSADNNLQHHNETAIGLIGVTLQLNRTDILY